MTITRFFVIMDSSAWATRLERPKGVKDEVKRPAGPPARTVARGEDIFAIFVLLFYPILKLEIDKLIYFTWIFDNFMHFFHRLR